MAGRGPAPMPPGRARRQPSRKATAAVLFAPEPGSVKVPELPPRPQDWHHPMLNRPPVDWHPPTLAWWLDLWHSPMAAEFDASDIPGLHVVAVLWDDFWRAETPRERLAVLAEIRLQGARFGLSPMDRRRLQWQIEETEAKQAQGRKHERQKATEQPSTPAAGAGPQRVDPRALLRSVPDPDPGGSGSKRSNR